MRTEEVRALLQRRVEEAGGAAAWARRNAVSNVYVGDVLAGRRSPGPGVLVPLRLRKIAAEARYVELAGE